MQFKQIEANSKLHFKEPGRYSMHPHHEEWKYRVQNLLPWLSPLWRPTQTKEHWKTVEPWKKQQLDHHRYFNKITFQLKTVIQQHLLKFAVVASIPEFSDSDSERGSLLMACSFSDNLQSKKTTQTNLGSVLLKFDELSNIRISIEPTCSGNTQPFFFIKLTIIIFNL